MLDLIDQHEAAIKKLKARAKKRGFVTVDEINEAVTKLFAFQGLDRVPVESARAGDIVAIARVAGIWFLVP